MIERFSLTNIKRLEHFWRNLTLSFLWAKDVNGATVNCYPQVPIYPLNHAADVNVEEDGAEGLLNRVMEHFLSKRAPYACFRISPLARPKSFASLLEEHGFIKETEDLVMVYKGEQLEDKLNPKVEVKEISESEIDLSNNLLLTIFEMPIEWKEGIDRLMLDWLRKGVKCYLAYFEGRPVGTCSLISFKRTGGIFNVGTLGEYRRQGIGTTLTAHAVMDSVSKGNNLHTLQTLKGGNAERLYNKIGFEIDHTVSWFVKKF